MRGDSGFIHMESKTPPNVPRDIRNRPIRAGRPLQFIVRVQVENARDIINEVGAGRTAAEALRSEIQSNLESLRGVEGVEVL